MAGVLDPGDHRLVARFLNDVNDAGPGNIGKRLICTFAIANKLTDLVVGQLYEGIYQYVQTFATSVNTPARGQLCYWRDYENYIVTPDPSPTSNFGGDNTGLFAGVYLNALTKGNYGFIQIAGKASVQFKVSITKTPAVQGNIAVADQAGTNTADVFADATAVNWSNLRLVLGVTLQTPINNSITLVDLWHLRQVMGGLGGF